MEIINCIQGSDSWINARRGIATASNFSKVVTSTGAASTQASSYAFQLASELVTEMQEEAYKDANMQRGNDLEPEAREAYEQSTLSLVDEVGFIKCDYYGYSPDGLVDEDGLIEIKCPKQNTHMKYLYNNKLPTEYKAQVQGGLLVTNRKWCDFISYHPSFEHNKRMLIIRVFRDEEYIECLRNGLEKLNKKKILILGEINKTKGKG